jgi:hypothetical protein
MSREKINGGLTKGMATQSRVIQYTVCKYAGKSLVLYFCPKEVVTGDAG